MEGKEEAPERDGGANLMFFLITASKRSLGQGNIFTGVCLSRGVCLGLRPGGFSVQDGTLSAGVSV